MIASINEIKSMLNIPQSDKTKDEMIQTLIPVAESFVETQTHYDFSNGYPKTVKLFVAKFIEWQFPNKATSQGIESEKFDSEYSVKYLTKAEDVPEQIMRILDPFMNLSW